MQLSYVNYLGHSLTEPSGTVVDDDDADGLISRLGVRFHRTFERSDGKHWQPYLTLNWWHDYTDSKVLFDQMPVTNYYPDDRYELKLGLNGDLHGGCTAAGRRGDTWAPNGAPSRTINTA